MNKQLCPICNIHHEVQQIQGEHLTSYYIFCPTLQQEIIPQELHEQSMQAFKITLSKHRVLQIYEPFIPNDLNGFQPLHVQKTTAMIQSLAALVKPLFKVKLFKLLWYIDAYHFKQYGKTITGLQYTHLPFGAVPIGAEEIVALSAVTVQQTIYFSYEGSMISAKEATYKKFLNPKEQQTFENIVHFFANFSSKQISEHMHRELAYTQSTLGEKISFTWAKQLQLF